MRDKGLELPYSVDMMWQVSFVHKYVSWNIKRNSWDIMEIPYRKDEFLQYVLLQELWKYVVLIFSVLRYFDSCITSFHS
jgi:hypothetical protein